MKPFINNISLKNIFTMIFCSRNLKHCAVSLLTAWCFVSSFNLLWLADEGFNPVENIRTVALTSITAYTVIIILIAALILFVNYRFRTEWGFNLLLFISVFILGIVTVSFKREAYTCLAVCGVVLLSFSYLVKERENIDINISKTAMSVMVAVPSVILGAFIGVTSVYRYLCYAVPNYDGGLFFQMFYYMREHFTMQTTLERDMLLSHCSVHLSPVFWLIYPIYFLFPFNETIQISQGIVLGSAAIPLSLLLRKMDFTRFHTGLAVTAFCFMPFVASGCNYDIHENMFLPVTIYCLLYSFECGSWWKILLSTVFLLGVKEDAGIYAFFIALFYLAYRKKNNDNHLKSLAVMGISLFYFVLAVSYIDSIGMNTATNRFNNMIYEKDGNIVSMIKTVFANPSYTVTQIMNPDNIRYMVLVLAPMLFIPVFCKDVKLYILAAPFVMFNLMPDYSYAHDIGFQYTFGSASLLFYMSMVFLKEKSENRGRTLSMMAVVSFIFFVSCMTQRTEYIKDYYKPQYRRVYDIMDEALSHVPEDAEVTAGTFLCGKLSDRDVIYEDFYTDKETEYLVLDLRGTDYNYDLEQFYHEKGYETVSYTEGVIAVFRKR